MESGRHSESPAARARLRVRRLLVLLLLRGVALAHTGTSSYADISLDERDVNVALQIAHADWQPIVDLDANRDGALTGEEVRAHLRRLESYVRTRFRVVADGRPCPGTAVDADTGAGFDATLTLVRMKYGCPAPLRTLTMTSALFAREHPGHRTFAIVRDATSTTTVRQHVFGPGSETLELRLDWRATGRRQTASDFLLVGIRRVLSRPDHVLVVLGLLAMAAGMRGLARTVAAFMVAYTIMLALGGLGVVPLEGHVAANGLALTSALVGAAGLLPRLRTWAWQLAFACGLVHGFAFADTFGGMRVAPAALGVSLAAFTAGIAVAWLALVGCLQPLIGWLRGRTWGAWALRGISVAVALAGLGLLVTRAS
jgi:hypothetical protein